MGYYVTSTLSNALLKADKLAEAHDRLCELNQHDEWKRGGDSNGNKWFSWMPHDYDKMMSTAKEILQTIGYDIYESDSGDIELLSYDDKHGCEDIFVWAISDLFEKDSYIEWRGEDGETWRWDFGGGAKMMESVGVQMWTKHSLYEPTDWEALRASWSV